VELDGFGVVGLFAGVDFAGRVGFGVLVALGMVGVASLVVFLCIGWLVVLVAAGWVYE